MAAAARPRPCAAKPGAKPCAGRRSPPRSSRSLIAAGWFGWQKFAPPPAPAPPPASAVVDEKLAQAPRLSIVVLPFANLSGDPEQDYFADGLTDDLTTDLSHLPDSFVIAHDTALAYKGKPVDAKQVGRDLGVRYALEGSVRRVGETITINAQLISTETGAHIWADRFEGERGRSSANCRSRPSRASPTRSASSSFRPRACARRGNGRPTPTRSILRCADGRR